MKIQFQSLKQGIREGGILFPGGGLKRVPVKISAGRSRIIAKFRAACEFAVPIGFQDETGFHLGAMARPE